VIYIHADTLPLLPAYPTANWFIWQLEPTKSQGFPVEFIPNPVTIPQVIISDQSRPITPEGLFISLRFENTGQGIVVSRLLPFSP
jgi:hypothetical protein